MVKYAYMLREQYMCQRKINSYACRKNSWQFASDVWNIIILLFYMGAKLGWGCVGAEEEDISA